MRDRAMALDFVTLAGANLAAQVLLFLILAASVYYAKNKKVQRHCSITNVSFAAQIILILAIMLPAMSAYAGFGLLGDEAVIHHVLGLASVALWIFINLGYKKVFKADFGLLKNAMRFSLGLWALSVALGLHLYWTVYTGI